MNICELLLTIIVSSVTGVGASYLVWWLTSKYYVPKIRFSEEISKLRTNDNPSNFKYRFKFENYGKRNIFDLEIIVRLRIKGLREGFPKNWEVIYIPTSTLEYKRVAIVKPVTTDEFRPVLEIKTYECDFFQQDFFPEEIRVMSRLKTLTLDDVLNIGEDANFQIMINGTDEFSGSRKFFGQKTKYTSNSIAEGLFDMYGLDVIHNKEQD